MKAGPIQQVECDWNRENKIEVQSEIEMRYVVEVFLGHATFVLSKKSSSRNILSKGVPWFDVHWPTLWKTNCREARVGTRQTIWRPL